MSVSAATASVGPALAGGSVAHAAAAIAATIASTPAALAPLTPAIVAERWPRAAYDQ
jgi:hypothetical protein